ncbi:unnamed protein product [Enterobius vermicularis]|uniref:Peptidase A1 domain-containing protein n=1 Tax=Enterobius vermicularis TaxID=51028 RepID=A0A0N4V4J5_ENTVE|nr:unnamed protein product [Enterobius vermicularis]
MTKDGKQKKFNNFTGPNPSELRIKFPSYKSPGAEFKQENDEQGRICFVMSGGTVEVLPPGLDGSKKYYVHLEVRFGIHGKPERCVNSDANGVYCDICSNAGQYQNFVKIFKSGAPAQCDSQGMPAGSYDDISLKVCLPNEHELLPLLDKKIPVVIAARLFDSPINNVTMNTLNDLLFVSKKGMIGCHYIYATATRT